MDLKIESPWSYLLSHSSSSKTCCFFLMIFVWIPGAANVTGVSMLGTDGVMTITLITEKLTHRRSTLSLGSLRSTLSTRSLETIGSTSSGWSCISLWSNTKTHKKYYAHIFIVTHEELLYHRHDIPWVKSCFQCVIGIEHKSEITFKWVI